MKRLVSALRACLRQAQLLTPDARLLCALSGGADSVALLAAACRLRQESGFALSAVHVQHNLRGDASKADEAFVRRLCQRLDVPLAVETLHLQADMASPGIETLARDARRQAFQRCMQATRAHALLLAHHLDDQAETVLMHLCRGSGLGGLCGMRPIVPFGDAVALRPFLGLPKRALLDVLEGEHIPHREDESNLHPTNPRNALRLTVLPALEALYPDAASHIAQAAQVLSAEEDCLAQQAERLFAQAVYREPPLLFVSKASLADAPQALVRRVLRLCRPLSHGETLAVEHLLLAPSGESVNLSGGWRGVSTARRIHFVPPQTPPWYEPPQTLRPSQTAYRFAHAHIQTDVPTAVPVTAWEAVLPPEVLVRQPLLRLPLPGDTIRPLGANGAKPLRRFFTDRKADPFLRGLCPVLAVGGDVLWVPGLCTAESLRCTHPPQSGALRLTATRLFDIIQSKE